MTSRSRGLVLFDLDNTLVDRQTAFGRWVRWFVTERGLGTAAVTLLHSLDRDGAESRETVFGVVKAELGLQESVEELIAEYRSTYISFYLPDPKVLTSLRRLRADGWRIGVATNGPPSQWDKLERTGILPLIDGCCVSDEVGVSKPDRRLFAESVARCTPGDEAPTTAYMVGDNPIADIAGGRAAGLRTIWISRGRSWNPDEASPDAIVKDVVESVSYIIHDR